MIHKFLVVLSKTHLKFRYLSSLHHGFKIPAPKAAHALSAPPANVITSFLKPNSCFYRFTQFSLLPRLIWTNGSMIVSGISKCSSTALDHCLFFRSSNNVPAASEKSIAKFPVDHQVTGGPSSIQFKYKNSLCGLNAEFFCGQAVFWMHMHVAC